MEYAENVWPEVDRDRDRINGYTPSHPPRFGGSVSP